MFYSSHLHVFSFLPMPFFFEEKVFRCKERSSKFFYAIPAPILAQTYWLFFFLLLFRITSQLCLNTLKNFVGFQISVHELTCTGFNMCNFVMSHYV